MDVEQPRERSSWSVGQLAQASGLSVRVLRHWEDMGLVTADRSPNGHRRYGPAQVTRLYRALALRRTDLGLSQIAALLDEQDPDPAVTLRAHVQELDEDLRRRGELRDRLVAVLTSIQNNDRSDDTSDQQGNLSRSVGPTAPGLVGPGFVLVGDVVGFRYGCGVFAPVGQIRYVDAGVSR